MKSIMVNVIFKDNEDYLIGKSKSFEYKKRLAIFDLDSTLIKTKSGNIFAKNIDDWKFLYNNINDILESYHNNNYSIIIITNQAKTDSKTIITKITNICKKLENIEICVFIANKRNKFRKPSPCFYYDIINTEEKYNSKSFYCGDAAGRRNDHSDCDYKFAKNCNILFKLPEQIFDNINNIILPQIKYPSLNNTYDNLLFTPHNKKKEMIVMIGNPGSGKSTIAKMINEKYKFDIVSQDITKTKVKCQKVAKQYIEDKKSFIIDNTNPDTETRKYYIDMAKKNNYHVTCIIMDTSKELSMHNNYYRCYLSNNTKTLIPEIAYKMFNKKFIYPTKNEGFDNIVVQNLCDHEKSDYYYYYLY